MAAFSFNIFMAMQGKGRGRGPGGGGRGRGGMRREKPEFDQEVIDLSRVTRVTKGGKKMNFRACIVIGDRRGRVGYGIGKGADVQLAISKAVNQAKKNMIQIPLVRETIPHRVKAKYKAGRVMIKPAPPGSGIIAGSSVRTLLELAGVPNASAKILSKTNNKTTNLKAAFAALASFKAVKKTIPRPEVIEALTVRVDETKLPDVAEDETDETV